MAAIPGWVYVILGIFMLAASQLIKSNDGSKPLIIFLYVGILFIIIGLGKYIFNAVFRKKEEKPSGTVHKEHKHQVQHPLHHSTQQHAQPSQPHQPMHHGISHLQGQHEVHRATQQPTQQSQHLSIIACPACSTRHYDYARYCMSCGTRIKKHR